MSEPCRPMFTGGTNIAIKLPHHTYVQTVSFYRNILGLPLIETTDQSCVFQFGAIRLWLDRVSNLSQPDIWLEVHTDDTQAAASYLSDQGVPRRDEVEPLPDDLDGFWIASPDGTIHLVSNES